MVSRAQKSYESVQLSRTLQSLKTAWQR